MKEYLKIIDEIIALVGLHLIPKFVNLYQGQVDIRCEENDTGVLIILLCLYQIKMNCRLCKIKLVWTHYKPNRS